MMNAFAKPFSIKGALAGVFIFAQTASLGMDATTLTVQTVNGFVNSQHEGTWLNDVTRCVAGKPINYEVASRRDTPMKHVVSWACRPQTLQIG